MKKLTANEFIKQARNVHGDKYNYSKLITFGDRRWVSKNDSEKVPFYTDE